MEIQREYVLGYEEYDISLAERQIFRAMPISFQNIQQSVLEHLLDTVALP